MDCRRSKIGRSVVRGRRAEFEGFELHLAFAGDFLLVVVGHVARMLSHWPKDDKPAGMR